MKNLITSCNKRAVGSKLAAFKERLLADALRKERDSKLRNWLRLAAGEAEALAWQTPCPLLVLPSLVEEKLEATRKYAHQQAKIRSRRFRFPSQTRCAKARE